jgi:exodeoxyribonuclease VII large subunit
MNAIMLRNIKQKNEKLQALEALLQSLNPDRPLDLGFARVGSLDGHLITKASAIEMGARLSLTFKDGVRLVDAVDDAAPQKQAVLRKKTQVTPAPSQGSLF